MSYFNMGDKVVCVCKDEDSWYEIGSEFTIRSAPFRDTQDNTICYLVKEQPNNGVYIQGSQFKLTKEEPKQVFNIKTDPWFIRVNSEEESKVIQDWLFEQGIMWKHSSTQHKYTEYTFILNVFSEGSIPKRLLRTNEACEIHPTAKEIKLTFKTTIDSVEYPVVETEQQIKMKQLQETIDKAARELKELREMGEKK